MSYRTRVNGHQIFGNNECYSEWLTFIKSQGIEINEEGNYEGEITDFMAALEAIEKITMQLHHDREGLFDFTWVPENVDKEDPSDKYRSSLFDEEIDMVRHSYALLPYQFFLACQDILERGDMYKIPGHAVCYKLKAGKTLHVYAG